MQRGVVNGVSVLHSDPDQRSQDGCVVIVFCGLGGGKECSRQYAKTFVEAGHAVILADNYNEGERRGAEPLSNRDGHKECQKKYFWKAIWKTAEDVPHLIDFAVSMFGTDKVAGYGESMGGDILLTALVFERRLGAVVAEVATPDWMRPNSVNNNLGHDEDGDRLYRDKCPCNNLAAFAQHPTSILIITGEQDKHVPGACAAAFVENLRSKGYYQNKGSLQHVSLPSCGSMGHAIIEDTSHRANAFISAMVSARSPQDLCVSKMPLKQEYNNSPELLKGSVSEDEMTDTDIDPDETISDDGDVEDWIWEMLGEDGMTTQIAC